MRTVLFSAISAIVFAWGQTQGNAGTERTQTLQLKTGWNAVFLEVQPAPSKPAEVFGALPVETVACFAPARLDAQYLRNPGDAPWRQEGWAVWHAPKKPQAFLSNLYDIQAQRAFLIEASADFTWAVTGESQATILQWYPNTCTFTGLPVNPVAPPTFAAFFAGSRAHKRVFRLENGTWKIVQNPGSEKIRSGEAYWIQTEGASTYQGPLRVKIPASGELNFDVLSGEKSLEFVNEGGGTANLRIERMDGALSLLQITRDWSKLETKTVFLPERLCFDGLQKGQSETLRLEPVRDRMKTTSATTLLRITDGRGTQQWISVRARRDALPIASIR